MPFSTFADLTSVLGFTLSVILLVGGATTSAKITRQLRRLHALENFESAREQLSAQLEANIELLVKDNITDRMLKADVFKLVGQMENYDDILSLVDRRRIEDLRRILSKTGDLSASDKDRVAMILSSLTGKLRHRRVFMNG